MYPVAPAMTATLSPLFPEDALLGAKGFLNSKPFIWREVVTRPLPTGVNASVDDGDRAAMATATSTQTMMTRCLIVG